MINFTPEGLAGGLLRRLRALRARRPVARRCGAASRTSRELFAGCELDLERRDYVERVPAARRASPTSTARPSAPPPRSPTPLRARPARLRRARRRGRRGDAELRFEYLRVARAPPAGVVSLHARTTRTSPPERLDARRQVPADGEHGARQADARGDRRQLVRRVRRAGEGRAGPLLDRARRQAHDGPRRPLRVPEAEGPQRPGRLVGLLQPGRRGRVRRLRHQPRSPRSSTASSTTGSGSTTRRRRSTSGRARTTTARRSAPAWTSCASAATARSTTARPSPEAIGEGIKANRWARSVDDVLTTLGYGGLDYVDILNSWGRGYPHLTRMPATVLERLWKEDGEVGLVTDR